MISDEEKLLEVMKEYVIDAYTRTSGTSYPSQFYFDDGTRYSTEFLIAFITQAQKRYTTSMTAIYSRDESDILNKLKNYIYKKKYIKVGDSICSNGIKLMRIS